MIVLQVVVFILLLAPGVMAAWEWRRRHRDEKKESDD